MIFGGNIVYLRTRSIICGPSTARDANDTARGTLAINKAK